jgi:hypothetical protein
MNRRKFFALLPAAPVALATWPTETKAATEDAPRDGEIHLALHSHNPSKIEQQKNIMIYNRPEIKDQVSMAVGQDGNLWLRTNSGEWKKVMTE